MVPTTNRLLLSYLQQMLLRIMQNVKVYIHDLFLYNRHASVSCHSHAAFLTFSAS